jgi:hypothetical protein
MDARLASVTLVLFPTQVSRHCIETNLTSVGQAIESGDLVTAGVLSGNRNFEGNTRGCYW